MFRLGRKNGASRRLSHLHRELDDIGTRVTRLSKHSLEAGEDALNAQAARLRSGVQSAASQIGKQGRSSAKSLATAIEHRPFIAVVSALAAGVVLSQLMRSFRD